MGTGKEKNIQEKKPERNISGKWKQGRKGDPV